MKVLQVHGIDVPRNGAAIVVHSLHYGLRKAGIDSRILCNSPTQPASVAMPRAPRAERMLSRVTMRLGLNDVHGVGAFRIKDVAFQEADVVHFHGIHGHFFSYLALPARRTKPRSLRSTIWALTGHCAVSYDCERWRTGCSHCPYPAAPPPLPGGRDGTRLEWKLKRWAYRHARMTVVALSTRMIAQLQQSILGHLPVCHIPNGVDTEVYRPLDPVMCRTALGIPTHKKVLLFAAANVASPNKGGALLENSTACRRRCRKIWCYCCWGTAETSGQCHELGCAAYGLCGRCTPENPALQRRRSVCLA